MHALIENLKLLNRKERYHLLRHTTRDAFRLAPNFRRQLESELQLILPEDPFVAMDYHLDWVSAALQLFRDGRNVAEAPKTEIYPNFCEGRVVLEGNQEDVDLFVAFEIADRAHLVLVEAKADSAWSREQLESKAKRLHRIFGSRGDSYGGVSPHFILMGPGSSVPKFPSDSIAACPEWFFRNHASENPAQVIPYIQLRIEQDLFKPERIGDSGGECFGAWEVKRTRKASRGSEDEPELLDEPTGDGGDA